MLSIALAAAVSGDYVIPYNVIDFSKLWPFIQDFVAKIGLFGTIGIAIFLAISGIYFLAKILHSYTN